MKKFHLGLGIFLFIWCANLLAVTKGDKAAYVVNKSRTSSIITNAKGNMEVIEVVNNSEFGAGYLVGIHYELNIFLKGAQKGYIEMFLPSSILEANFHGELAKNGPKSFGAFSIEHKGTHNVKDANGNEYHSCNMALSTNVNYQFVGGVGMAKVTQNQKIEGPIQYVTDLQIGIKAHANIPVIGAAQLDISGKSNNGIPFSIGLDFNP